MKRILFFCGLLGLLFCSSAQAALSYGLSFYLQNIGYRGSGGSNDPLYQFINEVETALETMTLEGGTTITFSNGGTFDNATNNVFEWNENSDELKWTFGSNTVTMSSTDVTLFDFGTIVLGFDQFKVNATTYTFPTADGSNGQVIKTNGSGTLSWVANGGGVSDLDSAYNGGGTIDVDTDAVTLTVSDTDNNAALALVQNDNTNDPAALTITFGAGSTGTGISINSQVGGTDISGDNWSVDQTGAITAASISATTATFTTLYKQAVVAASAGNVNLTIDAAGSGTITLGGTSTGKVTTDNLVELFGGVDIGDGAADTLTITGIIDSDVTLDDGVTHSPTLTLTDATNETTTFQKQDGGDFHITIAATEDIEIVTGNLAVGNGSPGTAAMDGEDFYVNGDSEFDGAVQFDGAITAASTSTFGGDMAINDQVAIAFNANDEEFAITGTATNMTAGAMMTLVMAAQDSGKYILNLGQTPNADADNDFIKCADNANADVKFALDQGGTTTWTLDAASQLVIDADTTDSTVTSGVINVDMGTSTTASAALDVKIVAATGTGNIATGVRIDVDDDTTDTGTLYALSVGSSDSTPAGGATRVTGIGVLAGIDVGMAMALDAASQIMTVDAYTATNTSTAGLIDIGTILSENAGSVLNIDVESEADGAGEIVHGIFVNMDDDADNADNELHGVHIQTDGTDGTGLFEALHIEGANLDAAIQCDTGYVRIGTGSTPDVTPGSDDLYVEGTIEVDGDARLDGIVYYPPMTETFTTEADITATLTSNVVLLEGDNDADNDTIDLQDGTYPGQIVTFIAHANIDADDTVTFNFGDTTAVNAPAVAFDKLGENVTLIWSGATVGWVVIGLQSSL